jgi:uncharacterized protein YccT (UPF0319 family)
MNLSCATRTKGIVRKAIMLLLSFWLTISQTSLVTAEDVQSATLAVPEVFDILYVDGNIYDPGLFSSKSQLKLKPGRHQLVIKYLEFLEINSEDFEKVQSDPFMISFTVEAGKNYHIPFKNFRTVSAADSFATKPTVYVMEKSTNKAIEVEHSYRVKDDAYLAGFESTSTNKTATATATTSKKTTGTSPPTAQATKTQAAVATTQKNNKALEMLHYWWQEADAEQKQIFLDSLK